MKYIKAFMTGVTLPSILLPILLCIAIRSGKRDVLSIPFIHMIPVAWGIWNMINIAFIKSEWLAGAILGLLVALYAVFAAHVPEALGFPPNTTYLPLIAAPILYAILWFIVVKPLNRLVGIA